MKPKRIIAVSLAALISAGAFFAFDRELVRIKVDIESIISVERSSARYDTLRIMGRTYMIDAEILHMISTKAEHIRNNAKRLNISPTARFVRNNK